jgi:pimeloyl-ACP methyl ester carboxylesterase
VIRGPRLVLPLAAAILAACAGDSPAPPLANGSFTVELDGVRIHYAIHGTGPVLMTVPNSWGLSHEGLRAMFRPLEDRLTVVYFDPRGMGGSGPVREESDRGMEAVRADFHALREHLGFETVHAIGWSNGAANLIYLAHEQPEALASAIFVHGGASFTAEDGERIQQEHPELARAFGEFTADVASNPALSVEEKTTRLRELWLGTYFPRIAADSAAARPLIVATFADAGFSWLHADYTQRTTPGFDARGLLPDIPVRSLVIAGAHDLLPPDHIRPLADGLPDAEFLVFHASGHFAPIEEPDAFRDAVFRFLGVD